jgi:hypothetical protein
MTPDAPKSLFDFIPPERIEQLRDERRAVDAAREKLQQLLGKKGEVQGALLFRMSPQGDRKRDADAAAAVFLGERPPPTAVSPMDAVAALAGPLSDADAPTLRMVLEGLAARTTDAEAALQSAQRIFRAGMLAALAIAQAAVEALYVTRAHELAEAWKLLNDALQVRMMEPDSIVSGVQTEFVMLGRLRIPGADGRILPVLAAASSEWTGSSAGPLLFDGAWARERGVGQHALPRLKAIAAERIGGQWPVEYK